MLNSEQSFSADAVDAAPVALSQPEHLRCVSCNAIGNFKRVATDELCCTHCDTHYDIVDGVPCIARYQLDEVLSLIEILSNLDMERTPPTALAYQQWADHLERYHNSDDKPGYLESLGGSFRQFLPHRYRQYEAMLTMVNPQQLAGASVLDVGAGEGFDTFLLDQMGAAVTAIEFSPISASLGKRAVANADWYCASAHCLPFKDESFDFVFCQAALHHFTSVPAAIREMMRVLKPGGTILTVSDSYRSIHRPELSILKQFNNDPAVLRGVNENVPCISEFFTVLEEFSQQLQVSIFTSRVFNFIDDDGKRTDIHTMRCWPYPQAYPELEATDGGLSLKITKQVKTCIAAPVLSSEVCRPGTVANRNSKKIAALSDLAAQLPTQYVNLDFPGEPGNTKFQLLNGWRYRDQQDDCRSAYSRARWFFARQPEQEALVIEVSATPDNCARGDSLEIFVAGIQSATIALESAEFQTLTLPLGNIAPGRTFCLEMKYLSPQQCFDDSLFLVRSIRLRATGDE